MRAAVIQRKEGALDMRAQNAGSALLLHFLLHFRKEGMDMIERIRGVGGAEGSRPDGGQMLPQMRRAARLQHISAKAAVNMQIHETGAEDLAFCIQGIGIVAGVIHFRDDAVLIAQSGNGNKILAIKDSSVFDLGHENLL